MGPSITRMDTKKKLKITIMEFNKFQIEIRVAAEQFEPEVRKIQERVHMLQYMAPALATSMDREKKKK